MTNLKQGTEGKHGGEVKSSGVHVEKGGKPIVQNHPYKEPVGPRQIHGHHFKGVNHGTSGTQGKR